MRNGEVNIYTRLPFISRGLTGIPLSHQLNLSGGGDYYSRFWDLQLVLINNDAIPASNLMNLHGTYKMLF